jgi:hypothetical protein
MFAARKRFVITGVHFMVSKYQRYSKTVINTEIPSVSRTPAKNGYYISNYGELPNTAKGIGWKQKSGSTIDLTTRVTNGTRTGTHTSTDANCTTGTTS